MTGQLIDRGSSRRALVTGGVAGLVGVLTLTGCTRERAQSPDGSADWQSLGEELETEEGGPGHRDGTRLPGGPWGLETSAGRFVLTGTHRTTTLGPSLASELRTGTEEPEQEITAPEGEAFHFFTWSSRSCTGRTFATRAGAPVASWWSGRVAASSSRPTGPPSPSSSWCGCPRSRRPRTRCWRSPTTRRCRNSAWSTARCSAARPSTSTTATSSSAPPRSMDRSGSTACSASATGRRISRRTTWASTRNTPEVPHDVDGAILRGSLGVGAEKGALDLGAENIPLTIHREQR